MSVKKLSPQNGGFIRAKLTRPRIFVIKTMYATSVTSGPTSGPLSRDRARILYLLILWVGGLRDGVGG